MRLRTLFTVSFIFLVASHSIAAPQTVAVEGASVSYEGISPEQASAIARTLAAARSVYADQFKFDMPAKVTADVACAPDNPTRLFNDGRDHISFSIAKADALLRPEKSGVFNLYGLCHELGHVAMYRTLKDRDWLTGAGAEGWAHYAGSVVVDQLWKTQGRALWSDPYDFSGDGTIRLSRQLAGKSPDDIDRAAGEWQKLANIIGGPQAMPALFAAWQSAAPDPAEPAKKLLPALLDACPAKRAELEKWWKDAAPLLVQSRPNSTFAKVEIAPAKLENKPLTLKLDDNAPDGKRSIAGGGHARKFETPAEGEWYLRSVSIHGARYGTPAPPPDKFDIALCDIDMHPIALWHFPYSSFERGNSKWVSFEIPPTLLPSKFYICAVFHPTARSGVFVDFDDSTHDHSLTATPGDTGQPLKNGDWMIRVEIDRAKGKDALQDRR